MAFLRKLIDKPTYILICGIWTAVSTYITQTWIGNPIVTTLIVTIGNLVIAWIGVESAPEEPANKPQTS